MLSPEVQEVKLNLGCGKYPLPGFVNLDKRMGWFFQKGLPQYKDASVDAVTMSHTLMYQTVPEIESSIREVWRVLKDGGIVRITEDDTENLLSDTYLKGYKHSWRCLTGPRMMRRILEGVGFIVHDVDEDITHFFDRSLMQNFHGGRPRCFFMEGIKPCSAKFTKYERRGDYHWQQYERGEGYKVHADKVKGWVKEKRILDVGAGDGLITYLLGAEGIDNEISGVRLAQKRGANVILGDAYSLPNKEYDAVIMIDVLEHLKFPVTAIQEARKRAGYLYITTPVKGRRLGRFHCQEWTPEELKKLVEENGFSLQEMEIEAETIYAKFKRKLDMRYLRPAIIYYTSNREEEEFARRIRQNILNVCDGIPIVSVSQKPIDFGKNICVGEVGINDDNLFRQVQIACQNTDADYIITTEADVIYPEDYFKFVPPTFDKVYRSDNMWILYNRKPGYYKKPYSEGGQIIGREFYLDLLGEALKDLPMWNQCLLYRDGGRNKIRNPFRRAIWQYFHSDPIISVKTCNGLRNWGGKSFGREDNLPVWGNSEQLKDKFFIKKPTI